MNDDEKDYDAQKKKSQSEMKCREMVCVLHRQ